MAWVWVTCQAVGGWEAVLSCLRYSTFSSDIRPWSFSPATPVVPCPVSHHLTIWMFLAVRGHRASPLRYTLVSRVNASPSWAAAASRSHTGWNSSTGISPSRLSWVTAILMSCGVGRLAYKRGSTRERRRRASGLDAPAPGGRSIRERFGLGRLNVRVPGLAPRPHFGTKLHGRPHAPHYWLFADTASEECPSAAEPIDRRRGAWRQAHRRDLAGEFEVTTVGANLCMSRPPIFPRIEPHMVAAPSPRIFNASLAQHESFATRCVIQRQPPA